MTSDTQRTELDLGVDETDFLISAGKVQGTPVFDTNGEDIGKVDGIMIDKRTGNVAYVVVTFGGFLGMGANNLPLPWHMLDYDTAMDGYVIGLSKEQLDESPALVAADETDRTTPPLVPAT